MRTIKPTLILSAGAFSMALMLSAPAMAAEGKGTRGMRAESDGFAQADGHRVHSPGQRGGLHGSPQDFAREKAHYRGYRGDYHRYRDHSHGYWRHYRGHRGHYRHRHGHSYWYRHRPYRRGHQYWWSPRYGQRYGYGYGHL